MPKRMWEGCVHRLYDAFWSLLEEKPYAQISVSELLARAGVSRGDFYYHYKNLVDLAKCAVEDEAKNWDDLTSLFLNFDESNIEVATDQIYYYLSSICRQNSLKAKRLSILISPHGSMYLVEAFREGFKDYIVRYRNLDLEKFNNMQKILFEGVVGFSTSLLVHLDLLKSLDREELNSLSGHLASIIYASIKSHQPGEKEVSGSKNI
ncbi:MAG: TetR/AcrR family transcriptional regulator [Aeriscardovia sp.]|nr:TetR/AcrR family transcriptional regulator [Aeriscardovia sp.]